MDCRLSLMPWRCFALLVRINQQGHKPIMKVTTWP